MARTDIRLGITLGDPAGIGPEVMIGAANRLADPSVVPVLIGRASVVERLYGDLATGYEALDAGRCSPADFKAGGRYLAAVVGGWEEPAPGKGTVATGSESKAYIDAGIDLWKRGVIDALVTGPVNKGFIEKTGCSFTGHTEYIASSLGEDAPRMLMFSRDYRVLLVTTHMPLAAVSGAVNANGILTAIRAGREAIALIDEREPRIAVAGLDPHCGDDGAIGEFDGKVTADAVRIARSEGIDVEGPMAADTLFLPDRWRRYDLVIAQYHDQGLIPFKMLAFDTGVNITIGLSITRTSPDHGTAYDIAGRRIAANGSALEAMRLACRLAVQKRR
ncbi:MAG TPA: 4-hydroxythreonine-4-phosphate dehydrogenase PdxA [Spirochaetota bacterium]|nr:4-hydroxythreonine-4-phosphate dehydrogenase PdxA [Spirochaetota bacterium]